MKILAFDTSNNNTTVAISDGQDVLSYVEDLDNSKQAERLIPMIEEALSSSNLKYNDIDYLGVTRGPGSFTGIRVGLAAAKGILISTDIKGIGITNFEMAHYRAVMQVKEYDKIIIFLNAYRNQLYTQIFDNYGNSSEPLLLDLTEALTLIERQTGKVVCTGSGVELVYSQIKFKSNLVILPRFARVKALHICRYVDTKIKTGSLHILDPLYIRPPDAKIKINNEKRIT
jgi:tRNA threonylcarbamoyl adenosine modification protein YeaZ